MPEREKPVEKAVEAVPEPEKRVEKPVEKPESPVEPEKAAKRAACAWGRLRTSPPTRMHAAHRAALSRPQHAPGKEPTLFRAPPSRSEP